MVFITVFMAINCLKLQHLNYTQIHQRLLLVVVDMTDPVAGWVKDGSVKPLDMEYTSKPASVWAYWSDFYDPESGIVKFEISIDVNEEVLGWINWDWL